MLSPTLRAADFMVAESLPMREVMAAVERYAAGERPVLICGEHGTGRELVARVLHQRGSRRGGRFVAVRPSFEGADVPPEQAPADDACARARPALHAARGGTLLVKDVCDMSALSQRTLRRAIRGRDGRKGEVDGDLRAGGPEASDGYDVRLVVTADLDLEQAVAAKVLSVDLYNAIASQRIDMPPLRDRADDLPKLFERWRMHYAVEIGRGPIAVSSRAVARLQAYPWPGNVAELKSVSRRLVLRVTGSRIEAGDVDEVLPVVAERVPLEDLSLEDLVKAKLKGLMARIDGYPVDDLYEKVLSRVERPLFDVVLAHTGGNQVKAAELLGLSRNTLRKKLQELGIASAASRGRKARADRALDE
ncbi:MAG: sigma-54-dependent Fis family transcriptional regulator [Myxococcales bacterium]|nr:sigma-54-dependent Fis family transcriptional regulator [Myxococcales bacterium]